MKKVLLLGDSIRIHYGRYVKMALEDVAEVVFPEDNCRFAAYLLRYLHLIHDRLGLDENLDAVHWNAGLWDLLIMPDGESLTPPEVYRYYLDRICRNLRTMYPKAEIIFATSTAVIEERQSVYKRYNSQIREYNAIGAEVARSYGFHIHDLYGITENVPEDCHSDITHFNTPAGAKLLTDQVVKTLETALDIRAKELDFDMLFRKETNITGI